MNDKTKKITAIIIIIFFLLAFVLPLALNFVVSAAPSKIQNQIKDTKNKINDKKEYARDVEAEIAEVDKRIDAITLKMNALDSDLDAHEVNLTRLKEELDIASASATTQYESLKKRIRVMYEQGTDNYLDILLSSGNITDFLNRFDIIQQVTEHDNKALVKLRNIEQEISNKKAEVEDEKKATEATKANKSAEKSNLLNEQNKRDTILEDTKEEIIELEKKYDTEVAQEKKEREASIVVIPKSNTKFTGGKMEWPAPGNYNITSTFGYRIHPIFKVQKYHAGIDIGAPTGATVVAGNDGTVIISKYSSSYGNYIMVDHGGGVATLYAHGSSLLVSVGTKVTRGQAIMKVGSTGNSTGPHLHYEVIVNGTNVNPATY